MAFLGTAWPAVRLARVGGAELALVEGLSWGRLGATALVLLTGLALMTVLGRAPASLRAAGAQGMALTAVLAGAGVVVGVGLGGLVSGVGLEAVGAALVEGWTASLPPLGAGLGLALAMYGAAQQAARQELTAAAEE